MTSTPTGGPDAGNPERGLHPSSRYPFVVASRSVSPSLAFAPTDRPVVADPVVQAVSGKRLSRAIPEFRSRVVCLHTPRLADGGDSTAAVAAGNADSATVGTVEHCACGLAGAILTVLLVGPFYPVLLDFVRPLHLLSSTVVVVALAATWFAIWLALEFVWEWRAGRLNTGS